jgi:DNA-binding transcriptional LysR family regulator
MPALTNWDDYRFFASLVETGSVRATADRLGVNASTVTRRLDALESRVGQKLFVRSHSGLTITADGEELMVSIQPLAARLGDLDQRLMGRGDEVAGTVRLTMPDAFAVTLMPEFARYADGHPRIRLEFLSGDRTLDLARGEADMAIRVTDQPSDSLIGRRLGRYRMAVYASRHYLETRDPVEDPEGCIWIESTIESVRAPAFKNRHFAAVPQGPRCNNVMLQVAAVTAHMGITLLPCAIGDENGALARVGEFEPMEAQDIWLLFHPDLRGVARIQSVSTFIQEAFDRLEPRLIGHSDN